MILVDNNFRNFVFDPHHIIEYGGLIFILALIYVETGFLHEFVLPGRDYFLVAAAVFCGNN